MRGQREKGIERKSISRQEKDDSSLNLRTPERDNTGKITGYSEAAFISQSAEKEIHFSIQLDNNRKADIFIEIHDPKVRRQQQKKHLNASILKGSRHFGRAIYIGDDELCGGPHAVAVARIRFFHSKLSEDDLTLAAACLIHLSNTIERITTIHGYINENKHRAIKKYEKHMQKTHIQALAFEANCLDEALETLRCNDVLFAQLIENKLAEKIPNYKTYQSRANAKQTYKKLNTPYDIFSGLLPAAPLDETEIIKPEAPNIRFPSHLFEQENQSLNQSIQGLCEGDNNTEKKGPNQLHFFTNKDHLKRSCIFAHNPGHTTDQNGYPKNHEAHRYSGAFQDKENQRPTNTDNDTPMSEHREGTFGKPINVGNQKTTASPSSIKGNNTRQSKAFHPR